MAFLVVNGSYLGPFQDTKYWSRDWDANIIDKTQSHEFIVALTLNHADDMHQELQHVSNPKSSVRTINLSMHTCYVLDVNVYLPVY